MPSNLRAFTLHTQNKQTNKQQIEQISDKQLSFFTHDEVSGNPNLSFFGFMTPKGKERHVLLHNPSPPSLILASSGVGMVGSCSFLVVGEHHHHHTKSKKYPLPTSPPHHPLNYNWVWWFFFLKFFFLGYTTHSLAPIMKP